METLPKSEGDKNIFLQRPIDIYDSSIASLNMDTKLLSLHDQAEKDRTGASNETIDILFTLTLPNDLKASIPLILCCVLDVSGSMSGEKMESLKKGMNYIIDKLTEKDHLIIVSFNDRAKVELTSTLQNYNGKALAKKAINNLKVGGGTDIVKALEEAIKTVQDSTSNSDASKSIRAMFLLTDGQDGNKLTNSKDPYKSITETSVSMDCPVFTYGFGSDHDAKVLNHIATNTKSSFTFVEDIKSIDTSFLKALGLVKNIVTKDMVFCATVPTPPSGVEIDAMNNQYYGIKRDGPYGATVIGGVQLSNVRCGFPYHVSNEPNYLSSDVVVQIGAVAVSEWRQVLLRLHLPKVNKTELTGPKGSLREATHWVLDAQVRFTELSTNKEYVSPIKNIVIRRIYEDHVGIEYLKQTEYSVAVEVARIREEAVKVMSQAFSYSNNGSYKEAKRTLDEFLNDIVSNPTYYRHKMAQALHNDVKNLATKLLSGVEFKDGGEAQVLSFLSAHKAQRSTDTIFSSTELYKTEEQKKIVPSGQGVVIGLPDVPDGSSNVSYAVNSDEKTSMRSASTFTQNTVVRTPVNDYDNDSETNDKDDGIIDGMFDGPTTPDRSDTIFTHTDPFLPFFGTNLSLNPSNEPTMYVRQSARFDDDTDQNTNTITGINSSSKYYDRPRNFHGG